MKKIVGLSFLLVNMLFAQSARLDSLLTTLERGNFASLLQYKSQHLRFDPQKIAFTRSASWLGRQLQSQERTILFQNLEFSEPLVLNRDVAAVRLIFVNCSFRQKVVVEEAAVSSHLAFIGCRFEDDVLIKRFSSDNLTLLFNSIKKAVRITQGFGEDEVGQLIVAFNEIGEFTIDAFNAHLNMKYAGKLTVKNLHILFNNFETARLSGAVCNKLMIMFGNMARRVEFNDLKLDYLLTMKLNVIDSCRIVNLLERQNALLAIANNSFQSLTLYNNTLRYASVAENNLKTISLRNLVIDLSFQLQNNDFEKNARILVKGCQFANFSFFNVNDSIMTAIADTLDSPLQERSKNGILDNAPAFPLRNDGAQPRYIKIGQARRVADDSSKYYDFEISDSPIDEKNWRIHFDFIRKIDGKYRLNPRDSVLASRHEVYTAIYNAYRRQGKWMQADDCYYEWKQFERQNFLKLSDAPFIFKLPETIFHHLNWISCGYGIKPLRIFPFAVLIVFFFALIYFITPEPISNLEQQLISMDKIKIALNKLSPEALQKRFADYDFDFEKRKQDLIDDIVSSIDKEELSRLLDLQAASRYNLNYLWNCFYFSFSTFTTVGLGDWYPAGNLNRAVVMMEGALGWLSLGLFITTYANVLLR